MPIGKILAITLWLLGATAMALISVVWMLAAEDGKVSAFVIVPIMWSVALGAGFVHHLRESGLLQRYRLGSRSLGALMPQ